VAHRFGATGSQLERYAQVLSCAEINSSFRNDHRPSTYARWAAATPPGFRFSVKLPSRITHQRKLVDVAGPLDDFLGAAGALGDRFGPLLVQLPGSLAFTPRLASTFFSVLRRRFAGPVVCEPRHASWFTEPAAARILERHKIGRVGADPARAQGGERPGGWLADGSVAYFRWHGAPRVYWSSYAPERIAFWAAEIEKLATRHECWCIFDNTASGAAAGDALALLERLAIGRRAPDARAPR
jgi:uncharacterized protein YecE (DUF72 family)